MYLDNNNHFYGKINGKSIFDFFKFNYNLDTCEERIDFLNQVLEMYMVDGVEFYHEYFDEVYDQDRKYGKINIVIGKDKSQYTESNVATTLEKLADYILAVDKKEEEIKYKIYTSEELFNRVCKEYSLINNVAKSNGGLELMKNNFSKENNINEVFPIFQLPKNYKKVKDLVIEKEDLEKYPTLKEYNDFYEQLKEESKRLWSTSNLTKEEVIRRGKIKKVMSEIKKDMLLVKKQLQKPIIWKSPLKDNGKVDYDELDMFDRNVVKELLRVHKGNDLQDDLTCILEDLKNLLNRVELTDRQKIALKLWSNGVSETEIANELNVKQNTVNGILNTVIGRIITQYEKEYTDWYYFNVCKGEYKKCSKCGEVKLTSEFNKNGKKGLYPRCKMCRRKMG